MLNKKLFIPLIISLIAIGYLFLNSCVGFKKIPDIVKLDEVFPGKPWVHVLPQMKPVQGVGGVKASDCGTCHQDIYNEWKTSTHSQALHDLQFQAELSKSSSPAWLCLNCHIPVQNQREYIVLGLEDGNFRKPVTIPNPGFDPHMREEGVTCATCHVHVNEAGESVIIGANGNYDPPHPVVKDPERLKNRCNDCHNAEYVLGNDLVCNFQTGREMTESPHLSDSEKSCHSCHLPSVRRSIVKSELNKPIRNSHKHTFWGGAVPKNFELYKSIPTSGYNSAFRLIGIQKGDSNAVNIRIKNTNPGHKLPSGDPERHLLIDWKAYKSDQIIQSGSIKIGQNWEWWPQAKLLDDNRLDPLEERDLSINLDSPISDYSYIELEVYHVRLTEENAKHMKDNYSQAGPRYKDKIRDLEYHYPFRTKVYSIRWSPSTGKRMEKKWEETIRETSKIKVSQEYNPSIR